MPEELRWHPIEEAMRDGTWYRLYIPAFVRHDMSMGYHSPGQREGYWGGGPEYGHWVTPGTMSSEGIHPSHFMELPGPPEQKDS